ncbi:MAG: hypothetical protein R2684_08375 [Pyrinomonadaceae bacterium]
MNFEIDFSSKIALSFSGLFLLCGMLTGVWKWRKIMASEKHVAPVYVDIAHRTSFFYSFACLVIAALVGFTPYGETLRTVFVAVPILFFALSVAGYIREGARDRTDNMFSEKTFVTNGFMYLLTAGEVAGFGAIFAGFLYSAWW